ncbi:MAG: AMP-binding protein [Pseudomonadota bacterium]
MMVDTTKNSGTKQGSGFGALLAMHAHVRGPAPAIRAKRRGIWHTTSWAELRDDAETMAAALKHSGVKRGGCVAFLGDFTPDYIAGLCATHALGAIALPLFSFATDDELIAALNMSAAAHLIVEDEDLLERVIELGRAVPSLKTLVFNSATSRSHYDAPHIIERDAFLKSGIKLRKARPDFLDAEVGEGALDDHAFYFSTPGAVGPLRLVVHSHESLLVTARAALSANGMTADDVAMAYLPAGWHCQMQVAYIQALVAGYCVCCPESIDTVLDDIREVAPTYLLVTPRVLGVIRQRVLNRIEATGGFSRRLFYSALEQGEKKVRQQLAGQVANSGLAWLFSPLIYGPVRDALGMSRVKVALTTGDAIDETLMVFYKALGINLKQLYGTAEAGSFVAQYRAGEVDLDTVGAPLDGVTVRAADDGEVLVQTPGQCVGLLTFDGSTLTPLPLVDGWLATGDIGGLDEDGRLVITDRKSDVGSLRSGAQFAPRQIERLLKRSAYIKEAVAFGANKDSVFALIDLDFDAVSRFADAHNADYTGQADLAQLDSIGAEIAAQIATINTRMAAIPSLAGCQVTRFAVLPNALEAERGLLTPIGTLKRDAIATHLASIVEAAYDDQTSVQIGQMSGQDGQSPVDQSADAQGDGTAEDARADVGVVVIRDVVTGSGISQTRQAA